MSLDLELYTSDYEWAQNNGGTDYTKIIVEMRGGNGTRAGDVELQLQRQDINTGVRSVFASENHQYSNEGLNRFTIQWDPVAEELTWEVENLVTGELDVLGSGPVPFGNQGWVVLFVRAGLTSSGTKVGRIQSFNTTFNGVSFGSFEIDIDTSTVPGPDFRLGNIIALRDADFAGGWVFNTFVSFTWGQNKVPPIPAGTLSPGDTTFYPNASRINYEVKLGDPPIVDGITGCLSELEADPPTCAEATGDGCFAFEYACNAGAWDLVSAECLDNSLCTEAPLDSCTASAYEFQELNTCILGDPAPTPVDPVQFAGCECSPVTDTLSVSFDGVDEYATIDDNPSFNFEPTDPWTLVFWLKHEAISVGSALITKGRGLDGLALDHAGNGVGGSLRVTLRDIGGSGGIIVFSDRDTDGTWPNSGVWAQLVVSYDGSNDASGFTFYRDGVVKTNGVAANNGPVTGGPNTRPFRVAADSNGAGTAGSFAAVLLDEIAYVNRVLTPAEVAEAYNGGDSAFNYAGASFAADVVSWWRCGDGDTFPVMTDNSGSNDLDMINMEAGDFVADVP